MHECQERFGDPEHICLESGVVLAPHAIDSSRVPGHACTSVHRSCVAVPWMVLLPSGALLARVSQLTSVYYDHTAAEAPADVYRGGMQSLARAASLRGS